jgi:hypothetical protein
MAKKQINPSPQKSLAEWDGVNSTPNAWEN